MVAAQSQGLSDYIQQMLGFLFYFRILAKIKSGKCSIANNIFNSYRVGSAGLERGSLERIFTSEEGNGFLFRRLMMHSVRLCYGLSILFIIRNRIL